MILSHFITGVNTLRIVLQLPPHPPPPPRALATPLICSSSDLRCAKLWPRVCVLFVSRSRATTFLRCVNTFSICGLFYSCLLTTSVSTSSSSSSGSGSGPLSVSPHWAPSKPLWPRKRGDLFISIGWDWLKTTFQGFLLTAEFDRLELLLLRDRRRSRRINCWFIIAWLWKFLFSLARRGDCDKDHWPASASQQLAQKKECICAVV